MKTPWAILFLLLQLQTEEEECLGMQMKQHHILTASDGLAPVDLGEERAAVVHRQVGEVGFGQHWGRRGHAAGRGWRGRPTFT